MLFQWANFYIYFSLKACYAFLHSIVVPPKAKTLNDITLKPNKTWKSITIPPTKLYTHTFLYILLKKRAETTIFINALFSIFSFRWLFLLIYRHYMLLFLLLLSFTWVYTKGEIMYYAYCITTNFGKEVEKILFL